MFDALEILGIFIFLEFSSPILFIKAGQSKTEKRNDGVSVFFSPIFTYWQNRNPCDVRLTLDPPSFSHSFQTEPFSVVH